MKEDIEIAFLHSAATQIRLYIDEDAMAHALVQGLRARGVDVTTVVDEGMNERDDNAQLERATQQRRVIYMFNVGDFCKLHRDYWCKQCLRRCSTTPLRPAAPFDHPVVTVWCGRAYLEIAGLHLPR